MTKTARTFLVAVLAFAFAAASQSASTAESEPKRLAAPPFTGPFGVAMGQHVEGANTANDGMPYDELNPPIGFAALTVYGTPSTGACAVLLLKQVNNPDAYGNNLRWAFEEISESLIAKYGEPSHDIDDLLHGSIWDEPRDWLMGLAKRERVRTMFWLDIDADENNGVEEIELELVAAPNTSVAFVRLLYEFSNGDNCRGEVAEKRNNQF